MSLKSATKTENGRVELVVEVGAEAFAAACQTAYRKNIAKINVPGFRKGKAPRALVEKMYGKEVFYEDAVNEIYPDALQAAIEESGYEFVDAPIDFDMQSLGEEGFTFKAVITVKPEVTLGEYKGIKVTKPDTTVSDEDIQNELESLRARNARLVPVEDRKTETGDTVTFDFDGYVDDQPFDGGKAEGYTLELGSGQFIPGFEEQMVGKEIDEEFDVNVTFPAEYHAEDLAGKSAVFKCKLHAIQKRELPEVDDELIKDTTEYDTVDQWKEETKKALEHQKEHAAEHAIEDQLLDGLLEVFQADVPEAMYNNRVDESVRGFEQRLNAQGLSMEMYMQYTGMTEQAMREQFREQAEKEVKVRLALEQIVRQESIQVTEEEINAEYERMAEMYKTQIGRVKAVVPAKELEMDLAVAKAVTLLKDEAKVSDKPAAKKPAAKKTATKKAADDAAAEEKPAAKKPAAKKTTSTAKKPAAKKTAAADEAAEKKPAAKKTATAKKPAAKKTAATAKTEEKSAE